jgi:hypothetical protein
MPPDRELDHEGQVLIGQLCLWMVFGPERDVSFGPLHSSLLFDALSQDDLSLKLLSLLKVHLGLRVGFRGLMTDN